MGLFYAYANSHTDNQKYRYVMIFPSRTLADEWWRTLQDKVASGKVKFSSIERVTPQFYLYHSRDNLNITQTVKHPEGAPEFRAKVIFSLQSGRTDLIPIQDIVDHISGNYFFIRSRYDSSLYWHYSADGDGFIKASKTERTRFRISIRPRGGGSARSPDLIAENYDGKIMIGSDNVQISLGADDTKFVCAVGPEEDAGKRSERSQILELLGCLPAGQRKIAAVTVSEMFHSIDSTPKENVGGESIVSNEPNIAILSGAEFSKQGILKLGKIPENFRFKEILDGLFDEWELAIA